jgi:hypothetical protein
MRALLLFGCLGCTIGAPTTENPPDDPDAYVQTLPDGPCAIENVTGAVPGVILAIRSASCVYRQGEIATLTYQVTLDGTTPTITIPADPPGGCGTCVSASSDPLSFLWPTIAGTSLGGADQLYCPGVSAGCCAPHPELTFQLAAGSYSRAVQWSGRTIDCPSDTSREEGSLFPAGRYEARARFDAYNAGSLAAQLPIELLDP